jgi:tetratricopeptide (TPR) repeat protein
MLSLMNGAAPTAEEISRLNDALGRLPEAGKLDRASASSFVAAARSALLLGRPDDALALGRAALVLDPCHARAWSVVGEALWTQGAVVDARAALEEAVAHDDRDLAAAVACARAQAATGSPTAARALLGFVLTKTHSAELRASAESLLASLGGEHPAPSVSGGSS